MLLKTIAGVCVVSLFLYLMDGGLTELAVIALFGFLVALLAPSKKNNR